MTEKAGNRLTERRWMNPEREVKKKTTAERGSRGPKMWFNSKKKKKKKRAGGMVK